jgi:hypothetical protein
MIQVAFAVNDEKLRIDFLRRTVPLALGHLDSARVPSWGHMTPIQMVEHLTWAAEISHGALAVPCTVHPKLLERFRPFLYNDTPTSHEFMNPILKKGMPADRYRSISEAAAVFQSEMERFFGQSADEKKLLRVHPVFGPLNYEDWERSHFKHFFHHLLQFGLIEQAVTA